MNAINCPARWLPPLLMGAIFMLQVGSPSSAQEQYVEGELYTIPWGDEPWTLSDHWLNQIPPGYGGDEVFWAAGHWVVSNSDELIILDQGGSSSAGLKKYSFDGTFIGFADLNEMGLTWLPEDLAVAITGEILLGRGEMLSLLDPYLNRLTIVSLPEEGSRVFRIFPTNTGSFWVVYQSSIRIKYYLVECFTNGNMSAPELLFEGTDLTNCNPCNEYHYVNPDGLTFTSQTDSCGFTYHAYSDLPGNQLVKETSTGEVVFSHTLSSDPGYADYEALSDTHNYFITWSGDFYTLHATAQGAVLTKYTLQNTPPVCDFIVMTPMPYQGPPPAVIVIDGTNSYDPDCEEILTFDWDFDGDLVFSEPVDDSYTGTPDHPTHSYTQNYNGPVFLKVSDLNEEESLCTEIVNVNIL